MSNKIRNFAILSQIKDNKISQKREMLYEIITKIHIRGGKGGEGGGREPIYLLSKYKIYEYHFIITLLFSLSFIP